MASLLVPMFFDSDRERRLVPTEDGKNSTFFERVFARVCIRVSEKLNIGGIIVETFDGEF